MKTIHFIFILFTYSLAFSQPRLALLIGNGNYPKEVGTLRNPTNDVDSLALSLEACGFEVIKHKNLKIKQLDEAVRAFGKKLSEQKGVGLFYFSGHGVQSKGENYLLATDFPTYATESDLKYYALPLEIVIGQMQQAQNSTNIIFLDACRSEFISKTWAKNPNPPKGLVLGQSLSDATDIFIGFATAPNSIANEGVRAISPFTESLILALQENGLGLEDLFRAVTKRTQALYPAQRPWCMGSTKEGFYFKALETSPRNLNDLAWYEEHASFPRNGGIFIDSSYLLNYRVYWKVINPDEYITRTINGVTVTQLIKKGGWSQLEEINNYSLLIKLKPNHIMRLQIKLKSLGYYVGEVTGVADYFLFRGVRLYERTHRSKIVINNYPKEWQTNCFDTMIYPFDIQFRETMIYLGVITKSEALQLQITNISTTTTQRIKAYLSDLGYDCGKIDDTIDFYFTSALQKFQKDNQLPTNGLNNETLQKLGIE